MDFPPPDISHSMITKTVDSFVRSPLYRHHLPVNGGHSKQFQEHMLFLFAGNPSNVGQWLRSRPVVTVLGTQIGI